jgi:hypothetical protein
MIVTLGALALVAAAPPTEEKVGAWSFRTIVDPMSDAVRGIAHTGQLDDPMHLVVKCDSNGDSNVYFVFISKDYLGSIRSNRIRPIKFRLDDSPPEDMDGLYDARNAGVLDVRTNNAGGRFLSRLAGSKKLTVQLTDYEGDFKTAVIDVSGARQALTKVATACRDQVTAAMVSEPVGAPPKP